MSLGREQLVAVIATALGRARVPLSDEKEAQAAISQILSDNGVAHEREHRLGPHDIPDFFCTPDLVIEAKMKAARPAAVYKQLKRYAGYDKVGALILVTNRAMGLPAAICGKPAYFISLGRAWL
ncbi:MAG TPA: hypothetical protein VGM17_02355 [Rhizomicrobium sp.]|jgi:hypothetical protein